MSLRRARDGNQRRDDPFAERYDRLETENVGVGDRNDRPAKRSSVLENHAGVAAVDFSGGAAVDDW